MKSSNHAVPVPEGDGDGVIRGSSEVAPNAGCTLRNDCRDESLQFDHAMLISIVIPCYNEERTVHLILEKVYSAPLPLGCTREIVVVDDCSRDGTRRRLEELQDQFGLTLVAHEVNKRGKISLNKRSKTFHLSTYFGIDEPRV